MNFIIHTVNRFRPYQWAIQEKESKRLVYKFELNGISIEAYLGNKFKVGEAWLTVGNYYTKSIIPYCNIYSVQVTAYYRRLGIASDIIEHSFKIAQKKGFSEMLLTVNPLNKSAICLYRKMGFVSADMSDNAKYYRKEILLGSNKEMIGMVKIFS
ncbi:GNAT family N-acetyltransferase [bacterium]|nr:GNAT family N-acetyltransferase [bacterium]